MYGEQADQGAADRGCLWSTGGSDRRADHAKKITLQKLDYNTIQELFSASQKNDTPKKPDTPTNDPENNDVPQIQDRLLPYGPRS